MTKITEKQLIKSLKSLKAIKPNKEWALLLKSKVLSTSHVAGSFVSTTGTPASITGIANIFFSIFSSKKLAYSFAALLFFVVGLFGFARNTVPGDALFPVKKIAEQSQAALTGQTGFKQNVAFLNSRINDLVQATKEGKTSNIPSAINEVSENALELTKGIKNNLVDSNSVKEIAAGLKTLADMPGSSLVESQDVINLYQTVVMSQIADLEKSTLTDDQKKILVEVKELYANSKYTEALEKILLISK